MEFSTSPIAARFEKYGLMSVLVYRMAPSDRIDALEVNHRSVASIFC